MSHETPEGKKVRPEIVVLSKVIRRKGWPERVYYREILPEVDESCNNTSPFTPYLDDARRFITTDAAWSARASLASNSRTPKIFTELQITLVGVGKAG